MQLNKTTGASWNMYNHYPGTKRKNTLLVAT